jgi:hypothetical protein
MRREKETLQIVEGLLSASKDRYVPPCAIAQVHAGLGRVDEALHWLNRAAEEHDVHLVMLPAEPKWDELRVHPPFLEVLRRCGLPTD